MKRDKAQMRRLHLLTDPEHPRAFVVVTRASEPEPVPVNPTPLSGSYRQRSSGVEATTAS